jgi:RNA polymerase sigma factor (TIGR02999 family)
VENTAEITRLLNEAAEGREGAHDELTRLVYADLRRLAEQQIRKFDRRGGALVSLEPASLVNEAYLRLITQRNPYDSRGHFFAIATKVMLRVLVDRSRARNRQKRGAGLRRITLSGVEQRVDRQASSDVVDVARALERLEALDARSAEVAKLRLVWGFSTAECARILDSSVRTVEREWGFARRWLAAELTPRAV